MEHINEIFSEFATVEASLESVRRECNSAKQQILDTDAAIAVLSKETDGFAIIDADANVLFPLDMCGDAAGYKQQLQAQKKMLSERVQRLEPIIRILEEQLRQMEDSIH